jgi:hypothetical protein
MKEKWKGNEIKGRKKNRNKLNGRHRIEKMQYEN